MDAKILSLGTAASSNSSASQNSPFSDTQASGPHYSFKFHGIDREYFKIWIVNLLLSILTLGIYSAWATVRNRRYFYGNTEINGHRFDYHARPTQILLGRLIAVSLLLLYILVVSLFAPQMEIPLLLLLSIPWLVLRSWRFHANMTSLSGVRFSYHCNYGRAYWALLLCPILLFVACVGTTSILVFTFFHNEFYVTAMAIGLVSTLPLLAFLQGTIAKMHAELMINYHVYGDQPFQARLQKRQLVKIHAIAIAIFLPFLLIPLLSMLSTLMSTISELFLVGTPQEPAIGAGFHLLVVLMTLSIYLGTGVSICYLIVARRNYLLSQITIGKFAQLHSHMKLGAYFSLLLTNILIISMTLGFGIPIARIRHAQFMANHTSISGDLSLLQVRAQPQQSSNAIAEEVAQAFNIELGL